MNVAGCQEVAWGDVSGGISITTSRVESNTPPPVGLIGIFSALDKGVTADRAISPLITRTLEVVTELRTGYEAMCSAAARSAGSLAVVKVATVAPTEAPIACAFGLYTSARENLDVYGVHARGGFERVAAGLLGELVAGPEEGEDKRRAPITICDPRERAARLLWRGARTKDKRYPVDRNLTISSLRDQGRPVQAARVRAALLTFFDVECSVA